jgi:hypothetical protein
MIADARAVSKTAEHSRSVRERENVPRWGHSCTGVARKEAVPAVILGDDRTVEEEGEG